MDIQVIANTETVPTENNPSWLERGSSLPALNELHADSKEVALELQEHLEMWGAWMTKEFGDLAKIVKEKALNKTFIRSKLVVFADEVPLRYVRTNNKRSDEECRIEEPSAEEKLDWYVGAKKERAMLIARHVRMIRASDAPYLEDEYPNIARWLKAQSKDLLVTSSELLHKFDEIVAGKRRFAPDLPTWNREIYDIQSDKLRIQDQRAFFDFSLNGYDCYFGFLGYEDQSINTVSFSKELYDTLKRTLRDDYWQFVDVCHAFAEAAEFILHDDLHHLAQFSPTDPNAVSREFMGYFRNGAETDNSHELWTIQQHKSRASSFKGREYAENCVAAFQAYFDRVDDLAATLTSREGEEMAHNMSAFLYGAGLFFLSHLLPLERSHCLVKSIAERIDSTPMNTPRILYTSPELGASHADPFEHALRALAIERTVNSRKPYAFEIPNDGARSSDGGYIETKASPLATWDHDGFRGRLGLQRRFPDTYWKMEFRTHASSFLAEHLPVDEQFPVPYPELAIDEVFEEINRLPYARNGLHQNLKEVTAEGLNKELKERIEHRYFSLTQVDNESSSHFERLRAAVFAESHGLLEIVHRVTQVPTKYSNYDWLRYWDMTSLARGY